MSMQLGPSHDAQRFRASNRLALAIVFVGVLLLIVRLVLVQYVRGERYEKYAAIERVSRIRAQAPRGLIKGADGTVIARNIESHRLEVLPGRVKPEHIPALAQTLRGLLDMTDAEYEGLIADLGRPVDPRKRRPLVVRRDLVSAHCPYDSSPLELVPEVPYGFCTTCGRDFEALPQKKACPFDQRKLIAVGNGSGWHCPSCDRDFQAGDLCPYDEHALRHGHHNLKCPLCQRTFNDEVAVLRANLHRLPEARVLAEIQREYPFRYLASHILGFMSYVDKRDLAEPGPDGQPRFGLNDRVGRSGLERALDLVLRGIDGEQILVQRSGAESQARDLDELIAAMKPRHTVPGMSVRLTLDLDLQRVAKVAMKDVFSGAAVVLDAHTGAVLVLYSKPSFDPNSLSGKRTPQSRGSADISAYAPLLDKALHAFPPASTYKVVAATAALEEGLITPQTTFHCPGYYEYGGRRFRCHLHRGHGDLNVQQALRSSCDVFFYHLGEQLGLDRLEHYARLLGFGEHTGIEIRESTGRIPTRDWYRDHVKGGYFPGFALSTAVGQKDVTTTPLQIARTYAGIGTGTLPSSTLLAAFEAQDGRLTVPPHQPARAMGIKASTLAILRAGLRSVVNDEGGTAYSAQPKAGTMAGKTGTAQAAQRPRADVLERLAGDTAAINRLATWLQNDHAWFVGYAPADDPQITVAVFVEHGGSGGHNAAPIARQIVEAWYVHHPAAIPAAKQAAPRYRKAAPQTDDAPEPDEDQLEEHNPEHEPSVPDEPATRDGEEPSGEEATP